MGCVAESYSPMDAAKESRAVFSSLSNTLVSSLSFSFFEYLRRQGGGKDFRGITSAPCQEGEEQSKHHLIKLYFSDLWLGKSAFQSLHSAFTLQLQFCYMCYVSPPTSETYSAFASITCWPPSSQIQWFVIFTILAPFWLLNRSLFPFSNFDFYNHYN